MNRMETTDISVSSYNLSSRQNLKIAVTFKNLGIQVFVCLSDLCQADQADFVLRLSSARLHCIKTSSGPPT